MSLEKMVGKTIIEVDDSNAYNAEIKFICSDGSVFKTVHHQSCCENVYFSDSDNPLNLLVGEKIVAAYYIEQDILGLEYGTGTYTFYTLATQKVSVTMRFIGESNGYYSEYVDFEEIEQ